MFVCVYQQELVDSVLSDLPQVSFYALFLLMVLTQSIQPELNHE